MNILEVPNVLFVIYSGTPILRSSTRFNDIPDLTINLLCPCKSYSKLYGAESRFNNIRFNDIPGLNDGNLATQAIKFFPLQRHN